MAIRKVMAYAPATIANLGAGFDILGTALANLGDIIIAQSSGKREVVLQIAGANKNVPLGDENVVVFVAKKMMQELDISFGIKLRLIKSIPVSAGLGGSAASSVATALAINGLLAKPLSKEELLPFTLAGEEFISGGKHADNAVPCLLGGLVAIRQLEPLEITKIPVKTKFYFIILHPHVVMETKKARALLPKSLPLKLITAQTGNLATLVAGLMMGDFELAARSMHDYIAEPVRAPLIPGFNFLKNIAHDLGINGCSISGSGPSVFFMVQELKTAKELAPTIKHKYTQYTGVGCDIYISKISPKSAYLEFGRDEIYKYEK